MTQGHGAGSEFFEELERCRGIAKERFKVDPTVTIDWSLNGLKAGECRTFSDGRSTIRLNMKIAIAEGLKFRSTIAHEYAHAVVACCRHSSGARHQSHGWLWVEVMHAFGYPAKRCHNYESAEPARHVEKFSYTCACGPVQLVGQMVHRKIQKGARYTCQRCRQTLRETGEETAEQLLKRIG